MTTALDIGPAKHQLKSRMEAIIAEHPVSVPRAAQIEFDSCLASLKILEGVGSATLAGVELNDLQVTSEGKVVTRRQSQSQDAYESGVAVAEAAPNSRKAATASGWPADRVKVFHPMADSSSQWNSYSTI